MPPMKWTPKTPVTSTQAPSLKTPPSSPALSLIFEDDSISVIATNELGMIADEVLKHPDGSIVPPRPAPHAATAAPPTGLKRKKRTRQPRKNVSRHFQPTAEARDPVRALPKLQDQSAILTPPLTPHPSKTKRRSKVKPLQADTRPLPPLQPGPRIINGLDLDEDLSSDSSLTSVPSDIGPDPFLSHPPPTKLLAIKRLHPRPKHPTKSPYFPHHKHKRRPQFISSILPFPPLSEPRFGLMQERLAHDPFRLLIATIFLNKTPGARAMPVFYTLMAQYPTPADLARADIADVVDVIRCLGFQNQRARKCVEMARVWVEKPPVRGRRWAKRDYPRKGDGRGMKGEEWVGDEADEVEEGDGAAQGAPPTKKVAWEISHLPGLGAYAHDSWRMFCRDTLRGVADGWNGEGAQATPNEITTDTSTTKSEHPSSTCPSTTKPSPTDASQQPHHAHQQATITTTNDPSHSAFAFEPEWKRVLPADKELRAWMTWMWLKEGWVWNKETGARTPASAELMASARGGGIVTEERERECLVVEGVDLGLDLGLDAVAVDGGENGVVDSSQVLGGKLDRPAGAFLAPSLGE